MILSLLCLCYASILPASQIYLEKKSIFSHLMPHFSTNLTEGVSPKAFDDCIHEHYKEQRQVCTRKFGSLYRFSQNDAVFIFKHVIVDYLTEIPYPPEIYEAFLGIEQHSSRMIIPLLQKNTRKIKPIDHLVLIYLTKIDNHWQGCWIDSYGAYTAFIPKDWHIEIFKNRVKDCSACPLGHENITCGQDNPYYILWYLDILIKNPQDPKAIFQRIHYADFFKFMMENFVTVIKHPLCDTLVHGVYQEGTESITLMTTPCQSSPPAASSSFRQVVPNSFLPIFLGNSNFNGLIQRICKTILKDQGWKSLYDRGFYNLNVGLYLGAPLMRVVSYTYAFNQILDLLNLVDDIVEFEGRKDNVAYQMFIPITENIEKKSLLSQPQKELYPYTFYFRLLKPLEKPWEVDLIETSSYQGSVIDNQMVRTIFGHNKLYQKFGFDRLKRIYLGKLSFNNYTDSPLYVWRHIIKSCKYPTAQ